MPKAASASGGGASSAASGDAGALIVHSGSGEAAEGPSSMSSNALTVAGGATSSNLSLGGRAPEKVFKRLFERATPSVLCCTCLSIIHTLLCVSLQVPTPTWHAPWKLKSVVAGHLGWVRCVAFEPGNQWFVTGAVDRTIKVRNSKPSWQDFVIHCREYLRAASGQFYIALVGKALC